MKKKNKKYKKLAKKYYKEEVLSEGMLGSVGNQVIELLFDGTQDGCYSLHISDSADKKSSFIISSIRVGQLVNLRKNLKIWLKQTLPEHEREYKRIEEEEEE